MQNRDLPLARLRPFAAAARHESFTQAADELGLTQTAVSRQIGQLEADIGVRLFERRNRAVFLTEEGRRLARVVEAALAAIDTEVAAIQASDDPKTVVLRCQLCEAFYWLMPRLGRFHAQHPEIVLKLVSTLEPLTHATESFDIAIQTTGRASGSARLLFTAPDEIFPVCAPSLLPDHPAAPSPQDLAALPLLSHRVQPQDWFDWPDWFAAAELAPPLAPRTIAFDSYPLVLQAAVAGQGVALGWKRTVGGLIDEGKLRPVSDMSIERPNEISVFRGFKRAHPTAVDHLAAWLKAELR